MKKTATSTCLDNEHLTSSFLINAQLARTRGFVLMAADDSGMITSVLCVTGVLRN